MSRNLLSSFVLSWLVAVSARADSPAQFSGALYSATDANPSVQTYFKTNLARVLLPLGRTTDGCWKSTGVEPAEFKLTGKIAPTGDVTEIVVDPTNDGTACVSEGVQKLHFPAPSAEAGEGGPFAFSFVYIHTKR